MQPILIAIAEDQELVRRGFVKIINGFRGVKVIMEAADGTELLQKINTATTLPDIVLMDINMEPMHGVAATQQLHQTHPAIKVIALSMLDDALNVNMMIDAGAMAYVLKSTSPDMLKRVITDVFEQGYYFDTFVVAQLKIISKDIAAEATPQSKSKINSKLNLLTAREKEFMCLCCSEHTYLHIAADMKVSNNTVNGYRTSVFSKLDIKSRIGVILFAIQHGLYQAAA